MQHLSKFNDVIEISVEGEARLELGQELIDQTIADIVLMRNHKSCETRNKFLYTPINFIEKMELYDGLLKFE